MSRTAALLTCVALGAAAGCRGCEEKRPLPGVEAAREPQSPHAELVARLAARNLDLGKKYPLAADGSVACGSDLDCFVVQAERCQRASVDTTQVLSGIGVSQRVQAVYRIAGMDADQCALERDVVAVESAFDAKVVDALRKKNKSKAEIESLENDALADLLDRYPSRIECSFEPDTALAVALDLAEGKYRPQPWREHCSELAGPKPKIGIEPQAKAATQ